MREISMSKKRATVMFNLPGNCRTTVQENEGKVDEGLRRAIEKARKVFFKEWKQIETEEKPNV